MSRLVPEIRFDDDFVEEALLGAVHGRAGEPAFRRERDRVYRLADGEREAAFAELHRRWFERLGLGAPVSEAVAELPLLACCSAIRVVRCRTRRDEGADLFVRAETGERTVVIRLGAASVDSRELLRSFLRFELLHVADMLDPAFGYDPELPRLDRDPAHEQLARERYRVVWDTSVLGRLARAGRMPESSEEACRAAFARAFPMLGDDVGIAFRRFFSARPAHAELLAFALAPAGAEPEGPLARGGRCPLCRFPTHDPEPSADTLGVDVVAAIAVDAPGWGPARGLCRQCADLYRARSLSLREAARLPGSPPA